MLQHLYASNRSLLYANVCRALLQNLWAKSNRKDETNVAAEEEDVSPFRSQLSKMLFQTLKIAGDGRCGWRAILASQDEVGFAAVPRRRCAVFFRFSHAHENIHIHTNIYIYIYTHKYGTSANYTIKVYIYILYIIYIIVYKSHLLTVDTIIALSGMKLTTLKMLLKMHQKWRKRKVCAVQSAACPHFVLDTFWLWITCMHMCVLFVMHIYV